MEQKSCRSCGEVKDLNHYNFRLRKSGKFDVTCRKCANASLRESRQKKRDKVPTKKCLECLKELPVEFYGKHKNRKDGINDRCNVCYPKFRIKKKIDFNDLKNKITGGIL